MQKTTNKYIQMSQEKHEKTKLKLYLFALVYSILNLVYVTGIYLKMAA